MGQTPRNINFGNHYNLFKDLRTYIGFTQFAMRMGCARNARPRMPSSLLRIIQKHICFTKRARARHRWCGTNVAYKHITRHFKWRVTTRRVDATRRPGSQPASQPAGPAWPSQAILRAEAGPAQVWARRGVAARRPGRIRALKDS